MNKTAKAMVVFFTTFMVGYFLLSCVGLMFFKSDAVHYRYSEIIGSIEWFIMYTMFGGWWIGGSVTAEYLGE